MFVEFPIQQPLAVCRKRGNADRRPAQARETERDPGSGITTRLFRAVRILLPLAAYVNGGTDL